ncbi:MAG: hypothetical protein HPY55_11525 [Firmicutes bacterium]|nr:hypothetical protein [Bacillota bacterium]
MSEKHPIRPGSLWRITVRGGRHQGAYPTVVEWVSNEDRAVGVGMPIRRGRFVAIPRGTAVHVMQDGEPAYTFDTVVEGFRDDGAPVLIVKYPEKMDKIQRRSFVRVPVTAKATVAVIRPDGTAGRRVDVNLKDISAGGVGFVSKEAFNTGDVVHMLVPSFEVRAFAEVIRVENLHPVGSPQHYVIGVRFRGIPEREIARMTRRIFHEQLVLRRKGLV